MSTNAKPTLETTMVLPAPTSAGNLLTGVSLQGHGADGIGKLASQAYKARCQSSARTLTAEKKKAEAAVAEAQAAYEKTVSEIVFPADFVADLLAVTASLLAFFPDAVAVDGNGTVLTANKPKRKRPTKANPAPVDDEEDNEDEYGQEKRAVRVTSESQFTASGGVRSAGRTLLSVSRAYDLPATVVAARLVVTDAQAVVQGLNDKLATVRTEMSKADEVGALATANLIAKQLSQTTEGQEYLLAAKEMVDQIGDAAGLLPAEYGIGSRPALPVKADETTA